MRIAAHGRSIDVPSGWEGRIYCRARAAPVLHVATFALRERDGDFGAAATGRMRPDDIFASLVEYRQMGGHQDGQGLFAARGHPTSLQAAEFSGAQLQVTRPGHLGVQRFFTTAGRTCCLYTVLRPGQKSADALLKEFNSVLATLQFTTRALAREAP